MAYKRSNGRIQERAASGRFRRTTGADVGVGVCPKCRTLTTRPELPKTDGPVDPALFNARVCASCGWDSRKEKP